MQDRPYIEQVTIFSATGEELGTGSLIDRTLRLGAWAGWLRNLSLDPLNITGRELRFVFSDGAEEWGHVTGGTVPAGAGRSASVPPPIRWHGIRGHTSNIQRFLATEEAIEGSAMMSDKQSYNEQITVFSAAGGELGTGRLIGTAEWDQRGEKWGWHGHLQVDFDHGDIVGQELRLVLEDGAEGNALCLAERILARRGALTTWSIRLRGNGMPPRVG